MGGPMPMGGPMLSNLPTTVAAAEPPQPRIPPSAQIPISSGVIGGLPENARTQIAPLPAIPGVDSPPMIGAGAPPLPSGYPVMSAEMRSQIEIGATVFPSEDGPPANGRGYPSAPPPINGPGFPPSQHGGHPTNGPGFPPSQHGGHPMNGPGMGYPMGDPNMGHSNMGHPNMGHPNGMPPSQMGGPQMGHPMGSSQMGPPMGPMGDPQRAANLMSPVGPQYGNRVDWTAAASAKIRVLPPWLLAVMFIVAIGLALTLTITIARLFS
jgi:hypothetical protein